jgi:hypothetical protein
MEYKDLANCLLVEMQRIANAQERLLAIAEEARRERTSLSEQMKKAFSRPLEEPK